MELKNVIAITVLAMLLLCMAEPALSQGPSLPATSASEKKDTFSDKLKNSINALNEVKKGSDPAETNATNGKTIYSAQLRFAKQYASGSLERIIEAIGVYRDRTEDSVLPSDKKENILTQIDSNITWFESKKKAIDSSTNVNEIKSIAREADNRWNQIKVDIKKESGIISCDTMDGQINDAKNVSGRISSGINYLKAQGKDTSAIEKKFEDYNKNIMMAERFTLEAREEFNKINNPVNAELRFRLGLQKLKQAQNKMNDAYADLKEIYRLVYGNQISKSRPF
ncbi:hypothetical protein CUJ83_12320 [Methanocella sp. CWC-04]|uniref:Uncharacterized protein n=1 Tax=Methanooceanicella nereidis TaxID=2052831 RepID=A0AAP2W6W7_9EURY|nr:hypothetical protein [Methanocella sp. CWC-04]MCD1295783.1 hypothetical protein [Methanocella sp. CWC-04]